MPIIDPRQIAIRDGIIARAVVARKIAPDRADDYRRMYDENPMGVFNLLTAPVAEGGLMAGLANHENPVPTEYPREWLDSSDAPAGSVAFEDTVTLTESVSAAAPQPARRPYPTHGISFEP